jgi:hypothetical protein
LWESKREINDGASMTYHMGLLAKIKSAIPQFIKDMFHMVEFCQRCGVRQTLAWTCDSDALWWGINGTKNGVLCPDCFDKLAWDKGIYIKWHAIEEYPHP